MGDQHKGRKDSKTNRKEEIFSFNGEVKWVRLKPDSNVVFSTKHNGKRRIIYYSSDRFYHIEK